jgi:predicted DNA-binding transcriptional regulator YafY
MPRTPVPVTSRNRQVLRQWQIIRALERRHGLTADDLALENGVSSRTIRRDIDALEAAGFPLIEEQPEDGARRWRVFDWRQEAV